MARNSTRLRSVVVAGFHDGHGVQTLAELYDLAPEQVEQFLREYGYGARYRPLHKLELPPEHILDLRGVFENVPRDKVGVRVKTSVQGAILVAMILILVEEEGAPVYRAVAAVLGIGTVGKAAVVREWAARYDDIVARGQRGLLT